MSTRPAFHTDTRKPDPPGGGATATRSTPGRAATDGEIDLGARIRTLRVANGATLRELASRAGVTESFLSQVERLRATYTFNNKMFVRTIIQNTRTNRDIHLYGTDYDQHSGNLGTQLLFAYKLNWQTVMYLGVGDLRDVTALEGDFERDNRQVFAKVSYAFQR